MKDFNHIDRKNNPCMVDISEKEDTARYALARTKVLLPEIVIEKFVDNDIRSKKGPVFQTSIIAGTSALKQTSNLIPFCHQINIESSNIDITLEGRYAIVECSVKAFGKTGVEMEALMGAQIAALTIYDMCKAFSHSIEIQNCYLVKKSGGKSDYKA